MPMVDIIDAIFTTLEIPRPKIQIRSGSWESIERKPMESTSWDIEEVYNHHSGNVLMLFD